MHAPMHVYPERLQADFVPSTASASVDLELARALNVVRSNQVSTPIAA